MPIDEHLRAPRPGFDQLYEPLAKRREDIGRPIHGKGDIRRICLLDVIRVQSAPSTALDILQSTGLQRAASWGSTSLASSSSLSSTGTGQPRPSSAARLETADAFVVLQPQRKATFSKLSPTERSSMISL